MSQNGSGQDGCRMFRGRARTSRVRAARTTSHRMGSGPRMRLARTVSEKQTERLKGHSRAGTECVGGSVCFFVYLYQEKWKMGFPSVDWNLNWPAEGSLTQANLQRFHFCREELSVRGTLFPGSTVPPLPVAGFCPSFSRSSPSQTRRSSSALKCV